MSVSHIDTLYTKLGKVDIHAWSRGENWSILVSYPVNKRYQWFPSLAEALLFAKDRIKEHLCATSPRPAGQKPE